MLIAQDDLKTFDNIFLGEGIKLLLPEENYSYYVYPILSNNEIIATIQVSKTEEGFAATYTKALASDLDRLKNKTSKDAPLVLIKQGEYLYAEIKGERTLLEQHMHNNENDRSSNSVEGLPVVDSFDLEVKNVYDNLTDNHASTIAVPRALVNKLPWTVYETQGNQPWCASITASNIIRNNLKRSITSATIRNWLGDYDGLTNAQVASYIRSALGVSSVTYTTSGSLGKTTVESEINSGRAIYGGFRDGSNGHAIAIIGYNNVAGAYHIHNPWYSTTETMAIGGTYVAGGYRFVWSGGSIYRI